MSLSPYLTDDEIERMTTPLTQGAARIKFIRNVLKLPVKRRPDGQPLVRRADAEGPKAAPAANDSPTAKPRDWSGFKERVLCGRGTEKKRREPAGA